MYKPQCMRSSMAFALLKKSDFVFFFFPLAIFHTAFWAATTGKRVFYGVHFLIYKECSEAEGRGFSCRMFFFLTHGFASVLKSRAKHCWICLVCANLHGHVLCCVCASIAKITNLTKAHTQIQCTRVQKISLCRMHSYMTMCSLLPLNPREKWLNTTFFAFFSFFFIQFDQLRRTVAAGSGEAAKSPVRSSQIPGNEELQQELTDTKLQLEVCVRKAKRPWKLRLWIFCRQSWKTSLALFPTFFCLSQDQATQLEQLTKERDSLAQTNEALNSEVCWGAIIKKNTCHLWE